MARMSILDLAQEKVVVLDGAMGTMIQQLGLTSDDFRGLDGCNEILVETRSDVIREIHAAYFEAGCDAVETNTFGGNGVVLAEYGLRDRVEELNRKAAKLAKGVAADYSSAGRPRFVLGSIGPGTRLPSLGQIDFDALKAAFFPQLLGLVRGGVDALCIETCQDLLQVKAVLDAARDVFKLERKRVPVFVSVTIEASGTMLVGSDIQTAAASILPMGVDVMGVNCATGPAQMKRHIPQLSSSEARFVMAMPNAGLPEVRDGELVYDLTPEAFGEWLEGFVREDGVGLVGGCCGTTPAHLAELVKRVGGLSAPRRECRRERGKASSLYQAVSFVQTPPPLFIGERMNANGSREFRQKLLTGDMEGMLAVARGQEQRGAHLLDVSVAYVGRDEKQDMSRLVAELVRVTRAPLCIDSTDPDVIEAALKLYGGRCVINSVNLEDGGKKLNRIAELASRFGAALIALAIDEKGMARTCADKLAVAERIHDICTKRHGLAEHDLIFDMLTFTVASGDPGMRRAAVETLAAIEQLKSRYPGVYTVLGVSNVSFGLKPSARRVLNSVFLSLAVERGLDMAIVDVRGILPLFRIPSNLVEAARRLLLDDWSQGDPLSAYISLFEGGQESDSFVLAESREEDATPQAVLRRMVLNGASAGLTDTLDKLLAQGVAPVEIINGVLIPAMKELGDLFGAGRTQLPFVLQSAEVMKSAVRHLEPRMRGELAQDRGVVVLATVEGDVHDIGKNLVGIILSNNGFKVVDLGTRVGVERMVEAVEKEDAIALGMSGLLVRSTLTMKENLKVLKRRGISIPVLVGGAALTRAYVERDLRAVYGEGVHYCADPFEALAVLALIKERPAGAVALSAGGAHTSPASVTAVHQPCSTGPKGPDDSRDLVSSLPGPRVTKKIKTGPSGVGARKRNHPSLPFEGSRVLSPIALESVLALVNDNTLIRTMWQYRPGRLKKEEYHALIAQRAAPALDLLKSKVRERKLIRPAAVYGYWRCFSRGNDLVILAEDSRELEIFSFPRKASFPHYCIADWFPAEESSFAGILGAFVATVGSRVVQELDALYAGGRYLDYLYLHGLAAQSAEATAEYVHSLMRSELGLGARRSARFSFGYPSCPNIEDQQKLFRLLDPSRIHVSLTEGYVMNPEFSVSAIVVPHSDARHFDLS